MNEVPDKIAEAGAIVDSRTEQWRQFLDYPLSTRTRQIFENAEILSVEQLTAKTAQEIRRYRGAGRVVLTEIRLALATLNLSLQGETVYRPIERIESDDLKSRLRALEQERDEILVQIQQIKVQISAQRPLRRATPVKNPDLDRKIFARWTELREYKTVAQEFAVTVNKVRSVVVRRMA